ARGQHLRKAARHLEGAGHQGEPLFQLVEVGGAISAGCLVHATIISWPGGREADSEVKFYLWKPIAKAPMRNQRLATIALFLCGSILLHGQDPAAFLFRQHSSVFNPALAGATGSQSVSLAYRQQWLDADAAGYQTALLAYDESLPCSILDYGIGAMWDMEGEGLLTTWEISPRVSVNLPLSITTDHHINLRLGGGFSF